VSDLTLQQVILRIVAYLLIASVYGFAIAASAVALGDPGPRYDGRLTLNPLRHGDVIGGLLTVLFAAGWLRPIAIDHVRLRGGRAGLVAIVVAACGATIILIEIFRLVRPAVLNLLPDTPSETFFLFVETLGQLGISFTLFNILPLPLLTGQHLLVVLFPRSRESFRRLQPFATLVLGLFVVSGIAAQLLAPANAMIGRALLND
jgi:Zn-dependent protease